jgi:gamma-glutamylcyclotransferase (GGCT)/AIG2-like uncharacterized protein YtfP
MIRVFVYGTLKPGEVSYRLCARYVIDIPRPAIARGSLYALPLGYPAMTLGRGIVRGYILSFDDEAILQTLDRYEQHAPIEFARYAPGQSLKLSQYERQEIEVNHRHNTYVRVWVYTMTTEQVKRLGGILLQDGQWNRRKQNALFSEGKFRYRPSL